MSKSPSIWRLWSDRAIPSQLVSIRVISYSHHWTHGCYLTFDCPYMATLLPDSIVDIYGIKA